MSVHEQFAEDLVLYALGTLEGDERLALEKHLEGCASCRRELEVVRGDLAVVALTASGPRPPVRSRERLMSAIAKEPRMPVAPLATQAGEDRGRGFAWWGVLGWAAALGLVLVAIGLMRSNSALERNVASLKADFGDQEAKLRQANDILATLIDPEAKKFELVAVGSKPLPAGRRSINIATAG